MADGYLKPIFENIPRVLRRIPQWVNWRLEERGGKATKPPVKPTGGYAKANDPSTWSDYDVCKDASEKYDGIGFVLTADDSYTALDFDKCYDPVSKSIDPIVEQHIKAIDSYTEISPSGRGLRVVAKGSLPVPGAKKGPVEIYSSGRYVTLTGHRLPGYSRRIENRQEEIDQFYNDVFPVKDTGESEKEKQPNQDFNPEDRLKKALDSKSGIEIKRLLDGDYSAYPSQSEADLALCSHLAFWFAGDDGAIDSTFRASGLFRGKWDEKHFSDGKTYGEGVIKKAISGCKSFYGDRRESQLDTVIQRLAALPPVEYDQVRKEEAQVLGIRQKTLDDAVKGARKGVDNRILLFTQIDPWPDPVDPAQLLNDVAATVRRFIVCGEEISYAVALWVAMTWFIEDVRIAPLIVITSPEKRCGKSLLLSVFGKLSARAITASSISPAALFRSIEAWKPTLLIDEADSFMKENEELRGILNSGHTRDSAYVIRTVGDDHTPAKFSTWGAKALAGIGRLPDTISDRSIRLELRRKLPNEKVDRIRDAESGLFDDLRSKLARFAEDFSENVRQAKPMLPKSLNDRAQDNWEPLLAIAMTVGNDWLRIGTATARKLSGGENETQTIGMELISDIVKIFGERKGNRIGTADLIKALCADIERPWATYNRGKEITPRQLSNRLNAYGIHSKTMRIDPSSPSKGYEVDQFKDAFDRYAALPPDASVTRYNTD